MDVFENIRNVYMTYYKLDPCHYFSMPRLSRNRTLRVAKVEMELFTNISMHVLCQEDIKGGLTPLN